MPKQIYVAIFLAIFLIPLGAAAARAETRVFTIIRKGEDIGTQVMTFDKAGDTLKVGITTRIAVKVMFVTAYKFTFDGAETWKNGKLVALDTHTNDNGEKHAVTVEQKGGKLMLTADGKSQEISGDTVTASWWNIKLVQRKELLDVLTGKMQPVTVKKIGSEKVKVAGADVAADHYEVTGGLQRDIWYRPDGKVVRQTLVKRGDVIEYALK